MSEDAAGAAENGGTRCGDWHADRHRHSRTTAGTQTDDSRRKTMQMALRMRDATGTNTTDGTDRQRRTTTAADMGHRSGSLRDWLATRRGSHFGMGTDEQQNTDDDGRTTGMTGWLGLWLTCSTHNPN